MKSLYTVAGRTRFITSQMNSAKCTWTVDAESHLVWVDMEVIVTLTFISLSL